MAPPVNFTQQLMKKNTKLSEMMKEKETSKLTIWVQHCPDNDTKTSISISDDENFLEVDSGDSCRTL